MLTRPICTYFQFSACKLSCREVQHISLYLQEAFCKPRIVISTIERCDFGCFSVAILVLDRMKYSRCYARYLPVFVGSGYVLLQKIVAVESKERNRSALAVCIEIR